MDIAARTRHLGAAHHAAQRRRAAAAIWAEAALGTNGKAACVDLDSVDGGYAEWFLKYWAPLMHDSSAEREHGEFVGLFAGPNSA